MFYVYVLRNEGSGKIYIGQTADLEKRLLRHNGILKAKIGSYTKVNKGKWIVAYKEEFNTRKDAFKREKYLKSHSGRDWVRSQMVR